MIVSLSHTNIIIQLRIVMKITLETIQTDRIKKLTRPLTTRKPSTSEKFVNLKCSHEPCQIFVFSESGGKLLLLNVSNGQ